MIVSPEPSLSQRAAGFARRAHASQKYGEHPYSYHLGQVATMVEQMLHGVEWEVTLEEAEVVVAAGWLHDVLEDTQTTFADLYREFGSKVATLVEAVTDEPGKNRKERKAKTLPKVRAAGRYAVMIKMADRLSNVLVCGRDRTDLRVMYKREHPDFKAALYDATDGLDNEWENLDFIVGPPPKT